MVQKPSHTVFEYLTLSSYRASTMIHQRPQPPHYRQPSLLCMAALPSPIWKRIMVKGTQDWDISWLRFWNLYYFFVSYVKILRFYKKKFLIGPFWREVRFFRVVLGLRGITIVFNLGQKNFFFNIIYDPFKFAKNSFSKIWSINCVMDGFQCQSWAKMSKFIPLSLRLSGIEFSLVSD
jgi:hypothetical protein